MLIKLSEAHYIIVDDSEIRKGKYFFANQGLRKCIRVDENTSCPYITLNEEGKEVGHFKTWKGVVTYSFGIELEDVENKPLSEVQEAINGYSVEKMAIKDLDDGDGVKGIDIKNWIKGFKSHQELVKDKLFTAEDMQLAFAKGNDYAHKPYPQNVQFENEYKQSLLPKTEWDVEIVEGKIKLI